jgi:hypothetical protein
MKPYITKMNQKKEYHKVNIKKKNGNNSENTLDLDLFQLNFVLTARIAKKNHGMIKNSDVIATKVIAVADSASNRLIISIRGELKHNLFTVTNKMIDNSPAISERQ